MKLTSHLSKTDKQTDNSLERIEFLNLVNTLDKTNNDNQQTLSGQQKSSTMHKTSDQSHVYLMASKSRRVCMKMDLVPFSNMKYRKQLLDVFPGKLTPETTC